MIAKHNSIKSATRLILINLAIFAALLPFAELAVRLIYCDEPFRCTNFYTRTDPAEEPNQLIAWMRHDADLGWVLNPDNRLLATKHPDYPFEYHTNNEGFRHSTDFASLNPERVKKRVMMLGDSFLFGLYLPEADTLSSQLAEKLGHDYEVFNLGIPGWGIDQMLIAYQKYVDVINPQIVIVTYIDNDVHRALQGSRYTEGVRKRAFEVDGGRLIPKTDFAPSPLEALSQHVLLVNKLFFLLELRPEILNLAETIFSKFIRLTSARGQQLIVLRYPLEQDVADKQRQDDYLDFGNLFHARRARYLDPYAEVIALPADARKGLYLGKDSHPSRAGNEYMAAYILREALRRDNPER